MSQPKTILVVDDTAPLRHIVSIYFTQIGHKTIEASDGEMALAKVNENAIDLIFLDVMMPKMNGYEVCRKLRENDKTKDIPVIICTAKGGQDDIVVALKSGANDYVVKPFSKDTILKKVEKFLGPSPAAVKAAADAKVAHEKAQAAHHALPSKEPAKEGEPKADTKSILKQPQPPTPEPPKL